MATDSTIGNTNNSGPSDYADDFDGEAWCIADIETFDAFCSGEIREDEIDAFRENAYQRNKDEASQ